LPENVERNAKRPIDTPLVENIILQMRNYVKMMFFGDRRYVG
jgi:hypothetical protein